MEWQPIETAPKDGSRFLAYDPNGHLTFFRWQDLSPYEAPVGWRDDFIQVYPEQEGPTHWMPLPPPPTIAKE